MVVRRAPRDTAGFSMLEATIALAVIAAVAGAFLWSGPRQVRATAAEFRATVARRLAEGVLEETPRDAITTGERVVALRAGSALPDATAQRSVREVEPGLLEVTALVRWREPGESTPRETRLVTWMAQDPER